MKIVKAFSAIIIFTCLHSGILFAQEIHATTEEGDKVLLFDDGTWRFDISKRSSVSAFDKLPSAKAKVTDEKGNFTFFYDPKVWQKTEKLGQDALFSFGNKDDNAWLMLLEEAVPLSYEEIKKAFLIQLKKDSIGA